MEGTQYIDNTYNEMLVQSVLRDRKIHINEEVNEISIFKVMYYMDKLKGLDDKNNIPIKARKPITITINTYGGMAYECFALISKIEQFKELGYKIITEVTGKAMSCGFFIFIVGSHRRIYRYGTLLCHQVSSGTYGTMQSQKEDIKETERLWEVGKDIIKKYTKIDDDMLNEIQYRKLDRVFDANEALKLNCADEIV